MGLKLIGAGLGRTGTESLKKALEHLGYSKCYHMFELMKEPNMLQQWQKLRKGEQPDYDLLFKDYQSSVDFPAAIYYKEFMQQYPDAKVILTVRNSDNWYASAQKTIFKGMPKPIYYLFNFFGKFLKKGRQMLEVYDYAQELVKKDFFNNRFLDKEYCKKVFNDWNAEVIKTVPADKLLVFEVKDGWEPYASLSMYQFQIFHFQNQMIAIILTKICLKKLEITYQINLTLFKSTMVFQLYN